MMIPKKGTTAPAAAAAASTPAATPAATPAPAPASTQTAAPPASDAPAASTQTAIAPAANRSVVVAGRPVNVIAENFKDKLRVEWNTLHRIQANNGNFLDLEANKTSLGDEITLNMMTFQDNWQISPGVDDPDATQYVRYSDDGKVTKQGEDCQEYLAALKAAGYTEAKMTPRVTIAGELAAAAKSSNLVGTLVQIDLSQTSKALFDRHQMQVALDVSRNKVNVDTVGTLKMTAKVMSGKGNRTWTTVEFGYGA